MSANKIVITGVCGFIGAHCANLFAREGWRVIGVDRRPPSAAKRLQPSVDVFLCDELAKTDGLAELLAREEPSALIHAAGPASVEQSLRDPRGDYLAQAPPFATALEAVRRAWPSTRVVLCSSAAVYGAPDALPIAESSPLRPISPYGWHKAAKEALLSEYVEIYGLRGSAARIFSTFGPGLHQLAVFELARKALTGSVALQGTGRETRDYLYVEDVAAALLAIVAGAPGRGEAINVGSGVETEIADLARRIAAHFGQSQARISAAGQAVAGKPTRWRADTTRLAGLGFSPQVPIEAALEKTLDWIAEHAR